MGSRDHSVTCATCGFQRGGLNDDKCLCDDLPRVAPVATFDVYFARKALRLFDAGQVSALVVAGHLPCAVDRIEALEAACRGGLGLIDGVEEPDSTLQAVAELLRAALVQTNVETTT